MYTQLQIPCHNNGGVSVKRGIRNSRLKPLQYVKTFPPRNICTMVTNQLCNTVHALLKMGVKCVLVGKSA